MNKKTSIDFSTPITLDTLQLHLGTVLEFLTPSGRTIENRDNINKIEFNADGCYFRSGVLINSNREIRTEEDGGLIGLAPGCKTPLQRINPYQETEEVGPTRQIPLFGSATLFIQRSKDCVVRVHTSEIPNDGLEINPGDIMMWVADSNSIFFAAEICTPPYKPGRYNILDPNSKEYKRFLSQTNPTEQ